MFATVAQVSCSPSVHFSVGCWCHFSTELISASIRAHTDVSHLHACPLFPHVFETAMISTLNWRYGSDGSTTLRPNSTAFLQKGSYSPKGFHLQVSRSVNWSVVLSHAGQNVWMLFHLEMRLMHTSVFGSTFSQYHFLHYIKMSASSSWTLP